MFDLFVDTLANIATLLALLFLAWLIRINFNVVPCGTYVLENRYFVELRQADHVLVSIPFECH